MFPGGPGRPGSPLSPLVPPSPIDPLGPVTPGSPKGDIKLGGTAVTKHYYALNKAINCTMKQWNPDVTFTCKSLPYLSDQVILVDQVVREILVFLVFP